MQSLEVSPAINTSKTKKCSTILRNSSTNFKSVYKNIGTSPIHFILHIKNTLTKILLKCKALLSFLVNDKCWWWLGNYPWMSFMESWFSQKLKHRPPLHGWFSTSLETVDQVSQSHPTSLNPVVLSSTQPFWKQLDNPP